MAKTVLIHAVSFLVFFLVIGIKTSVIGELTSKTFSLINAPKKRLLSGDCPCFHSSWCNPIRNLDRKEIVAFSEKNDSTHWKKFDWSKVTTVVMKGYHNDQLVCMAHALNARVSYIAEIDIDFRDQDLRKRWIQKQMNYIQKYYLDGINFDYEKAIDRYDQATRDAYTNLVAETNAVLKKMNPYSQVSVDVGWKMGADRRYYDYVGLSKHVDFLFVMAYAEQSQIFGECVAMPNSAFDPTFDGINGYLDMGIKKDQLVLGVPWYGYVYPCIKLEGDKCYIKHVAFRGVNCSDAAGIPKDYAYIDQISNSSTVKWNETSMTPYFTFPDGKTFRQAQFDNPQSLELKYSMAVKMNLRGVGIWYIDSLNYDATHAGEVNRQSMFRILPKY